MSAALTYVFQLFQTGSRTVKLKNDKAQQQTNKNSWNSKNGDPQVREFIFIT